MIKKKKKKTHTLTNTPEESPSPTKERYPNSIGVFIASLIMLNKDPVNTIYTTNTNTPIPF
jgi:hypothetical protein